MKTGSQIFIFLTVLNLSLLSSLQGWPMKGGEKLDSQQEQKKQEARERVDDLFREEEREATMSGIKESVFEETENASEVFDVDQLNEQTLAAQQAQQRWKEIQQWIQNEVDTISIEEKNNLLEKAREDVEYWNDLRDKALAIPDEIAENKTKEILKFVKASLQATREAQVAQKLLEKFIQEQDDSFSIEPVSLSLKQLSLETAQTTPQTQSSFETQSKTTHAPDLFFSQEKQISYHTSEIIKLLSGLMSPQSKTKEESFYKRASRLLEKFSQSQNSHSLNRTASDVLAKLKSSNLPAFRSASQTEASKLERVAHEEAEKAEKAFQQWEYKTAISFYEHALQLAEEAYRHAQNAIDTYQRNCQGKTNLQETTYWLQKKIREWNIKKCEVTQKFIQREQTDIQKQEQQADQEDKNEIGSTCRVIKNKLKVIERHYGSVLKAYQDGDAHKAKELEDKASNIQTTVDSLKIHLQNLQNQMAIWKQDYQTEASRYLETQEEPQSDGTKRIKSIYKRRFVGPLIRIERVVDSNGNIVEEAKMAAEHLLITLNDGKQAEELLQNLQAEFPDRNVELKELSKESQLYALHFLSTPDHPFNRLEMLSVLQRKLTQEHLVKSCSPDYLMQLCSSNEKINDSFKTDQEPWSFHGSYGIHPPADLFNPPVPLISHPSTSY